MYNKTQLNPETTFERHVFHRDQFAHFLRWTYVLNLAKIGMKILDVGCGSGNLYEVFYRNRYKPERFLGVDVRNKTIEKNKSKFPKAEWKTLDPVKEQLENDNWDIITSFEVLEHIHKNNGDVFLQNIKSVMGVNTLFLMSTPVYDKNVGAAANHTYDGMVHERTFKKTRELLEKYFKIDKVFGTFASQKDYKKEMTDEELKIFNKLNEYYDSNLVSVIFAPLFPKQSRNCIWQLKIK